MTSRRHASCLQLTRAAFPFPFTPGGHVLLMESRCYGGCTPSPAGDSAVPSGPFIPTPFLENLQFSFLLCAGL